MTLTISSFNVEWSKTCKTNDYLFVGQIIKYSQMRFVALETFNFLFPLQTYLCGNTVPKGTTFKSKNQQITIRFHSNNSVTRPGFKIVIRGETYN